MKDFKFSSGKISFSSLPTKFERKIFKLIIDGRDTFSTKKLSSKLNVSTENLLNLIEKFQKKVIIYKDDNKVVSTNILTGYEKIGDTLILNLSKKLEGSLSKDTFTDFKILFNLTDEVMMRFYLDICKKTKSITETTYSLKELKKVLNTDKYERFYDFEKFILKKLKKGIEKETSYQLSFEKVKENGYKNSKVSHVKVIIAKKSYYENSKVAFEILKKTDKYNSINIALLILIDVLEDTSVEEVYKALDSFNEYDTIEETLKKVVNQNKNLKKTYKCIYKSEESISNIIKLQNKIFKIIKGIDKNEVLYDHFVINHILKELYTLISKDELVYRDENIKIQINHLGNKVYNIKVYSK